MFLDIGIGILGAVLYTGIVDAPITPALLAVAVGFALLPDTDFIVAWMRSRNVHAINHTHRDVTHYPLLYIPVGSLAVALLGGLPTAMLFAALSLLHFIHDSIGIGWGIQWAYPFSKKFYKAFSEKDGRFSWRLLVAWTPSEQAEVERQAGDPSWLRNIYLRFHPIAIIELLFFIGALAVLWSAIR